MQIEACGKMFFPIPHRVLESAHSIMDQKLPKAMRLKPFFSTVESLSFGRD